MTFTFVAKSQLRINDPLWWYPISPPLIHGLIKILQ